MAVNLSLYLKKYSSSFQCHARLADMRLLYCLECLSALGFRLFDANRSIGK